MEVNPVSQGQSRAFAATQSPMTLSAVFLEAILYCLKESSSSLFRSLAGYIFEVITISLSVFVVCRLCHILGLETLFGSNLIATFLFFTVGVFFYKICQRITKIFQHNISQSTSELIKKYPKTSLAGSYAVECGKVAVSTYLTTRMGSFGWQASLPQIVAEGCSLKFAFDFSQYFFKRLQNSDSVRSVYPEVEKRYKEPCEKLRALELEQLMRKLQDDYTEFRRDYDSLKRSWQGSLNSISPYLKCIEKIAGQRLNVDEKAYAFLTRTYQTICGYMVADQVVRSVLTEKQQEGIREFGKHYENYKTQMSTLKNLTSQLRQLHQRKNDILGIREILEQKKGAFLRELKKVYPDGKDLGNSLVEQEIPAFITDTVGMIQLTDNFLCDIRNYLADLKDLFLPEIALSNVSEPQKAELRYLFLIIQQIKFLRVVQNCLQKLENLK